MEYKIFEGDFRPDFSWSYVLIKEIPSLDIMRCLMREGGFHRWQYRWLKAITISVLGTSRCDAYTVNKEVQTIIIIFDGVLLYNLLHNFSASWSHNQAMINTQRKIITYIALKSCLFFCSSDLNLYCSMDVLRAETRCNKLYSKIQSNYRLFHYLDYFIWVISSFQRSRYPCSTAKLYAPQIDARALLDLTFATDLIVSNML